MTSLREISSIANCLVCDSFFIVIIGTVPPNNQFSGKKGKVMFEEILEKIQNNLNSNNEDNVFHHQVKMFACPTCAETIYKKNYLEYVNDSSISTIFSPCLYHIFEENEFPAIYEDVKRGNGKPKWSLIHGVGPYSLELDSSRSGRIYKPSLKEFFIDKKNRSKQFHKLIEDFGNDFNYEIFCNIHNQLSIFWDRVCLCETCGNNNINNISPKKNCLIHYEYWKNINNNSNEKLIWLNKESNELCIQTCKYINNEYPIFHQKMNSKFNSILELFKQYT